MANVEVNHDFATEILCVKFPGIVKSSGVQQAIQALGGNAALSQALSKGSKLELNLIPDSMFHKPTHGDLEKTDAVLLKVKKKSGQARVVGVVKDNYCFKNVCDFQFLPPGDPDTTVFPLSTVANPATLIASDTEPSLYLPAMSLTSRMDLRPNYAFSNRSLIVSARPSRKNHTQRIPFSMSVQLPTECLPGAIKVAESRNLLDIVKEVEGLFRKRPMWTRAAILAKLNMDKSTALAVLPCVSFFFLSGPWRLTWCRHGYDPRKDPNSKLWQTVEFRAHSLELRKHLKQRHTEKDDCVFRDGEIPSQLNNVYQLEDIHVKEVRDLLLDNPFKTCHEKYGWISASAPDAIRKLLDEKANDAVISKYGRSLTTHQTDDQHADSDDSLMVLSNKDPDSSDNEEGFSSSEGDDDE